MAAPLSLPWVSKEGMPKGVSREVMEPETRGGCGTGDPPHLQACESILHGALIELDHVGVHVTIVATNVPLCAAIRYRAKTEGWVLVLRPLKL